MEKLSKNDFLIGKEVAFGRYRQSDNPVNGKEKIQWIVLARDGEKALLLSKYGLDAKPYHLELEDITWEECMLRQWLNHEFINVAFTMEEQAAILVTKVDNSQEQGCREYKADGGNDTEDKVFLLSYKETFKEYFVDNESRICKPSAYAKNRGAEVNFEGNCWWWLRSPGYLQYFASCVHRNGSNSYRHVYFDVNCVRPAIWVNLDADVFVQSF